MKTMTLAQLAQQIGATLEGDGQVEVESIGTLAGATSQQVSFLANSKYRSQLQSTQAAAVIVHPDAKDDCPKAALVHSNPYVGFALAVQALDTTPDAAQDIAPSAVIADSATLGANVAVGANAVIEAGATLGDNVQIGPGCFVGKDCQIGAGSKLWANVTLYHATILGENCLIQSGTVVGADGFGYANDRGKWIKIPQLGRAVLGNNVEVGANSCIDRGALEDTLIGDGVIIDNLCQIAHNVEMGEGSALAGCSVIAGSAKVGKYCVIGGFVAINGHMEIADQVHITGYSMVTKSITEAGVYSSGMPATDNRTWRKNMVALRNLHNLNQRLKALEKGLTNSEDAE